MQGQIARLNVRTERRGKRTVLAHQFHTAPLKIAKPFRLPSEESALYLQMMDASPGMLDGDHYEYTFELQDDCHLYLTNQASTKLHPATHQGSRIKQRFQLGHHALLEYFPEPVIPYRDSRFTSDTQFHLADSAIVFYGEIVAAGRMHHGETFTFSSYAAKTTAYMEGELIAWDHFRLEPARDRFASLGAIEHYTHFGTLWIWGRGCQEDIVQAVREAVGTPENSLCGVSLSAQHGIALRVLSRNVWQARHILHKAWSAARVRLLGRPAPVIRR